MANVMDLFYTDRCDLIGADISAPNMFGICHKEYVTIKENIPCCLTPISSTKAKMKYGVETSTSFEISMDTFEGLDVHKVSAIKFNGTIYEVQSYDVYSEFLILSESVTFLVKKVN